MSWSFNKKADSKDALKQEVNEEPSVAVYGYVPTAVHSAMLSMIDALPSHDAEHEVCINTYGHVSDRVNDGQATITVGFKKK
jgi:hypothetical protein